MQKIGARTRNKTRAINACNKIEKRIIFHFLRWIKEKKKKEEKKKKKRKKKKTRKKKEQRGEIRTLVHRLRQVHEHWAYCTKYVVMQKIGARARNKMRAINACNKIENWIILHFLRWKKKKVKKKKKKEQRGEIRTLVHTFRQVLEHWAYWTKYVVMQKIGARARNKMRAINACNKIENRIILHFLRWKKVKKKKEKKKEEKKRKKERKINACNKKKRNVEKKKIWKKLKI